MIQKKIDITLLWWSWLMFKQNNTKEKWLHDEYKIKSWVDDM